MQENRKVPLRRQIVGIPIPGGIEPGETVSVQANIASNVFPDEPGQNSGTYLRASLVAYQPYQKEVVEIDGAVTCRCVFFDAIKNPQNSVGVPDLSKSAVNPLEFLIESLN